MVIKVRKNDIVRSMSILIAYGINNDGWREILGLWLDDSESESTWSILFKDLKSRGLNSVDLVVSGNHSGLVKSLRRHFQEAALPSAFYAKCTKPYIFKKQERNGGLDLIALLIIN